jgi:hypothetical protein
MRTRTPPPTALSIHLPDAFPAELDSFLLSCEAENLAPRPSAPMRRPSRSWAGSSSIGDA